MNEDVTKIVLVGLTKAEFIGYSIWALAGLLFFFLASVVYNVKKSKESWSWRKFWTGMARVGLGLITTAVGVVFFDKIANFMLDSETPISLTPWSAFTIVGLGSDRLAKRLAGYIPKKNSK